ncbi:MAG: hypothetical protein DHS20C18_39630 [Saprospiraceae bacterium]|nr:MAG: hypothetical protein DHS20C18_39630 [Saprospiraceae bacterium]
MEYRPKYDFRCLTVQFVILTIKSILNYEKSQQKVTRAVEKCALAKDFQLYEECSFVDSLQWDSIISN